MVTEHFFRYCQIENRILSQICEKRQMKVYKRFLLNRAENRVKKTYFLVLVELDFFLLIFQTSYIREKKLSNNIFWYCQIENRKLSVCKRRDEKCYHTDLCQCSRKKRIKFNFFQKSTLKLNQLISKIAKSRNTFLVTADRESDFELNDMR